MPITLFTDIFILVFQFQEYFPPCQRRKKEAIQLLAMQNHPCSQFSSNFSPCCLPRAETCLCFATHFISIMLFHPLPMKSTEEKRKNIWVRLQFSVHPSYQCHALTGNHRFLKLTKTCTIIIKKKSLLFCIKTHQLRNNIFTLMIAQQTNEQKPQIENQVTGFCLVLFLSLDVSTCGKWEKEAAYESLRLYQLQKLPRL